MPNAPFSDRATQEVLDFEHNAAIEADAAFSRAVSGVTGFGFGP